MDIFISWSGEKSGACANLLRTWLPCVMQSLKPWCSSEDIAKGARGGHEIAQKLGQVNFGIVCLTPSNLHNEWIHFESGALSKNLDGSALCTLLLDLQPADIKPPLGHFQHTRTSKDEIFKLTKAINIKTDKPLNLEVLSSAFEAFWPKLEAELASLPIDSSPLPPTRPEREILEEILSVVRGQSQTKGQSKLPDPHIRRTLALIGFAEGVIQTRKVEGTVNGRVIDGRANLTLKLQGTDHEVSLPLDDYSVGKETLTEFIFAHTISDDDIPF